MMSQSNAKIVAVALLTRDDVATLSSALKKVFLIESEPYFGDLLSALDQAERANRDRR